MSGITPSVCVGGGGGSVISLLLVLKCGSFLLQTFKFADDFYFICILVILAVWQEGNYPLPVIYAEAEKTATW